jgi:hypothetical protein
VALVGQILDQVIEALSGIEARRHFLNHPRWHGPGVHKDHNLSSLRHPLCRLSTLDPPHNLASSTTLINFWYHPAVTLRAIPTSQKQSSPWKPIARQNTPVHSSAGGPLAAMLLPQAVRAPTDPTAGWLVDFCPLQHRVGSLTPGNTMSLHQSPLPCTRSPLIVFIPRFRPLWTPAGRCLAPRLGRERPHGRLRYVRLGSRFRINHRDYLAESIGSFHTRATEAEEWYPPKSDVTQARALSRHRVLVCPSPQTKSSLLQSRNRREDLRMGSCGRHCDRWCCHREHQTESDLNPCAKLNIHACRSGTISR